MASWANVSTSVHVDGTVPHLRYLDFVGSLVEGVLFQRAFVSCHHISIKKTPN